MKNTIIAVDLDETLLDDNLKVSKQNKIALNKAQKQGATIVVSSSRNYASCKKVAEEINADFVCSFVGNMIADRNGKILMRNSIPQNETIEFVDTFYDLTQEMFVDTIDGMHGIKNDFSKNWNHHYASRDELKNIEAYKFFIKQDEKWNKLVKDFCLKNKYVCLEVRTAPYWFITKKNSDKYNALQKLKKIIGKTTLFVFGDDFSDLKSLQKATFGVAMANSRQEVLAKAKYKTKSNNESGVAYFLKKFL